MEREEFLRQFAKELTLSEFNDKPYRDLPKEAIETAKNNNIVIVYGQSDDLMEFDGAYMMNLVAMKVKHFISIKMATMWKN